LACGSRKVHTAPELYPGGIEAMRERWRGKQPSATPLLPARATFQNFEWLCRGDPLPDLGDGGSMNIKVQSPVGPDAALSVGLSFVGGFVDSAAFVGLFGLFTAHVTGNFVMIGDQLALGSTGILAKLLALPVFALAVALSRIVALLLEQRGASPLRPLLLIEAGFIFAFGASGIWLAPFSSPDTAPAILVGMLAVAAMGVQNGLGRLVVAHLAATTVMTVDVAQATIDSLDVLLGFGRASTSPARSRLRRMGPAIVGFAVGALAGAFAIVHLSFGAAFLPVLILLALAVMA
jgi:uncharacterized membrane protein YoaK (UPF0700 family)